MDKILDYIKSKKYISDIIYIAIGSRVIRDTKPENIGDVIPWVWNARKLTQPIATWFIGPNLVLYPEPDENGRPDM